uniref:Coiled-coil domain containing 69 n=1 Tax=Sus scrofa TaxID=9823 RepID=A0A8D1MMV7_PIG
VAANPPKRFFLTVGSSHPSSRVQAGWASPRPQAPHSAFGRGPSCGLSHCQRRQGPDQPPRSEPQELGPLNGDTTTTVRLCTSEEAGQHPKAIARLLQQHEEDKKKWALQVEKERELELGEKLDEQRRVLEKEHEEALQVLRASYEQEKEALTHSFQEAKAALQETIDGLTAQLEAFQAKMKRVEESILSRDYKKHIQEYGSPSQFWEQELESLHFVIEMKNERIHDLDKRLILTETVVCGQQQRGAGGRQPHASALWASPLSSVQRDGSLRRAPPGHTSFNLLAMLALELLRLVWVQPWLLLIQVLYFSCLRILLSLG